MRAVVKVGNGASAGFGSRKHRCRVIAALAPAASTAPGFNAITLVTSGGRRAGCRALGAGAQSLRGLVALQAARSIGQAPADGGSTRLLSHATGLVAQVLLTAVIWPSRRRYQNASATLGAAAGWWWCQIVQRKRHPWHR